MIRYLVPGVYHVQTRMRTLRLRISWLVTILLVIVAASWSAADAIAPAAFALVLLLALGAWEAVYEIGYLENDLVTVLSEATPTQRLDPSTAARLRGAYVQIVVGKLVVAVVFVGALVVVQSAWGISLNVSGFVVGLVLMRLAFALHNASRSRIAILTFFLLQVLKYGLVPVLFVGFGALWPWILGFAVHLAPMQTLEYASLTRFGLARWVGWVRPHARFRVVYHVLALVAALSAWAHVPSPARAVFVVAAVVLVAFRGLAWWFADRTLAHTLDFDCGEPNLQSGDHA